MSRLLLAILLVAAPILCAGQTDAPVRRPEVRVGDSWTYRSTNVLEQGTYEHETRVSFVDDKVILAVSTRKSDRKEFDSSWTLEWNAVTTYGGLMYRPHSGLFRFPLRIGSKHAVKYELLWPQRQVIESSTDGSVTVAGWETVEVPAGRFRAIKLELESVIRGASHMPERVQITYWYVPDVRRWVKYQFYTRQFTGGEELLEYKLNED